MPVAFSRAAARWYGGDPIDAPDAPVLQAEELIRPARRGTAGEAAWRRGKGVDYLAVGCGRLVLAPGGPTRLQLPPGELRAGSRSAQVLFGLGLAHVLALQGGLFIHGACFTLGARHVLAIGRSGSGKSSLAAAVTAAGGRIVSDDALVARVEGEEVRINPLRPHLSLRRGALALLPAALAAALEKVRVDGETRWFLPRDARPDVYLDEGHACEVWTLRIDRRLRHSRRAPQDAAAVLAALINASSPLFLAPRYAEERRRLLPVLITLANRCRGAAVRLGADLLADPAGTVARLADG